MSGLHQAFIHRSFTPIHDRLAYTSTGDFANMMLMKSANVAKSQKKMGKGMLIIAWLIIIGLLTLGSSEWLAHQENPNQDPLSTTTSSAVTVILKGNRYGHYVANGSINNAPVKFLLDTGATTVVIPAHLAKRLQLTLGPTTYVSTANGDVNVYMTRIAELKLGSKQGEIRLTNVAAHINPHMTDNTVLLGMSALKHLELVQRKNQLTLRQFL